MRKFKVLTDSLSWISNRSFKKGDIVTEKDYPNFDELINRGFLIEVKEIEETPTEVNDESIIVEETSTEVKVETKKATAKRGAKK